MSTPNVWGLDGRSDFGTWYRRVVFRTAWDGNIALAAVTTGRFLLFAASLWGGFFFQEVSLRHKASLSPVDRSGL